MHDLAFVLVQYGVPAGEAKQAMRKFDSSGDGELSFDEFKVGFKPLVVRFLSLGQLIRLVFAGF